MGEYQRGADDIAGTSGTGRDVAQAVPAAGEQGEGAFAETA